MLCARRPPSPGFPPPTPFRLFCAEHRRALAAEQTAKSSWTHVDNELARRWKYASQEERKVSDQRTHSVTNYTSVPRLLPCLICDPHSLTLGFVAVPVSGFIVVICGPAMVTNGELMQRYSWISSTRELRRRRIRCQLLSLSLTLSR